MNLNVLSEINYLAVAAAAVAFFMIGAIWFSVLFGKAWKHELTRLNIKFSAPNTNTMVPKNMFMTFIANCIAAKAMALLVYLTHSDTLSTGLCLGLVVTVGFALTTLASGYIWENRSRKLFLIDAGYQAVGIITCALILSVWH